MKHTTGPWFILGADNNHGSHIAIHDGCDNIVSVSKALPNAMSKARLIAAAPEQHEAHSINLGDLEMLAMAIEAGDPKAELLLRVKDMNERTKAAITKATHL